MWTRFMDMYSGGRRKEKFAYAYIEAPEKEAIVIFYNRFGHNPNRVSCSCCGKDYSISEETTLEQATGFERGCDWVNSEYVEHARSSTFGNMRYQTLEQYTANANESVLVIRAEDIKPDEKVGTVPKQGYVWLA